MISFNVPRFLNLLCMLTTHVHAAYVADKDIKENIDRVNDELKSVNRWIKLNGLTLYIKKCQFMFFPRSKRKLPDILPDVLLDSEKVERCLSTKYLGVYLDENLRWNVHVGCILRKISEYVPILYNVWHNLSKYSLKLLYNSLIYPFFIYCNTVWGSANKNILNSLLIFQKKIIIIISFKERYEHTVPLFIYLNCLNPGKINKYMSGLCVHKSLNSNNSLFTRYKTNNYNTRLSTRYTVSLPNISSSHSRQSMRWVGCIVRNGLSQYLRDAENYDTFKITKTVSNNKSHQTIKLCH